ncbi:uncharacterized protein MONBRDRAFT_33216 [Monosiga brevicollis MX1]|uniref:Uncharacterized protein n=1 Tax=Monosiga brevicollis TaxID=81824 RepID=A9V475_MONBE|nr:uncharacterized protein MONBRDRAFT_33216 [Monosiga brevicollis MX1]EDQ87570.1 predicted protein [Monosiga brevicollis MX1]|eukprot:XP_001747490.1 hypothetical protein [Monosiga brevicollis MX1]
MARYRSCRAWSVLAVMLLATTSTTAIGLESSSPRWLAPHSPTGDHLADPLRVSPSTQLQRLQRTWAAAQMRQSNSSDLDILRARLVASLQVSAHQFKSADSQAQTYLGLLQPNCTFANIDYNDQSSAEWSPGSHMRQVQLMAAVYSTPGTIHHKNGTLLNGTLCATEQWIQMDLICPNWWWNDIAVPQALAASYLLLGTKLVSPTLFNNGSVILDRAQWWTMTAANLVWEANVQIMRYTFSSNTTGVAQAYEGIYTETDRVDLPLEGIQYDGSFHQHMAELLSGSYGADFTATILDVITQARGTSFYIHPEQMSNFTSLMLDGEAWMSVGTSEAWDISVTGRGITRPPGWGHVDLSVDELVELISPRHAELDAFALRLARNNSAKPLYGHRHFYDSDYTIMRGDGFQYSIRMYSARTVNARCVNDEGKQSQFTANGMVALYYTGYDYDSIFPTWNWQQLPGTLLDQLPTAPSCGTTTWQTNTEEVGGVSNGKLGAAFMAQHQFRPMSCVRSWGMFPDALIATAHSITAPDDIASVFTLADRRAASTVTIALHNGTHLTLAADQLISLPAAEVAWVHHDNTLYALSNELGPVHGTLAIFCGNSTGNWIDIGVTNRTETVDRFFAKWQLPTPTPHSAGYLMVPAVSLNQAQTKLDALMKAFDISIDNQGAAYSRETTTLATLSHGGLLAIRDTVLGCDKSCALLVESPTNATDYNVTVSAPAASSLTVTLPHPATSCDNCRLTGGVTCVFATPAGNHMGQSVMATCQRRRT